MSSSQPKQGMCVGCGSKLQSSDILADGFVPPNVSERFSSAYRRITQFPRGLFVPEVPSGEVVHAYSGGKYAEKVMRMICQRCYHLQNYHVLSDDNLKVNRGVFSKVFTETDMSLFISQWIFERHRPHQGDPVVVLLLLDIRDFESSIVSTFYSLLTRRHVPVIFVLNKMDCLSFTSKQGKDSIDFSTWWNPVRSWACKISKNLRNVDKKNIILTSSMSGRGFLSIESAIARHMNWDASQGKREMKDRVAKLVVAGRVNSGKSAFIRRFLKFVGYKHAGSVDYQNGVGGLPTSSPVPGTTLNFIRFNIARKFLVFDTPGIPHANPTLINFLENSQDVYSLGSELGIFQIELFINQSILLRIGKLILVSVEISKETVEGFEQTGIKKTQLLWSIGQKMKLLVREKNTNLLNLKRHFVLLLGPQEEVSIPGMGGWIRSLCPIGLDISIPDGVSLFRRPSIPQQIISTKKLKCKEKLVT